MDDTFLEPSFFDFRVWSRYLLSHLFPLFSYIPNFSKRRFSLDSATEIRSGVIYCSYSESIALIIVRATTVCHCKEFQHSACYLIGSWHCLQFHRFRHLFWCVVSKVVTDLRGWSRYLLSQLLHVISYIPDFPKSYTWECLKVFERCDPICTQFVSRSEQMNILNL